MLKGGGLKIFFFYLLFVAGCMAGQDVRVEAVLDTSKLRIGEQVKIDLYVSYPANANGLSIQWPRIGDTLTEKVEVISVTGIDTTLPRQSNSPKIFQHQQITVSVYDSGYYAIPGFRFTLNNDSTKELFTQPLLLEVHTVPTDTSAKAIKDIKTVLGEPFNWKWYLPMIYWIIGALLLVAAIILVTVYYTKKKKQVVVGPEKPKIPPHILALQSLEKIKTEHIWTEGKVKEYYSSISDTVRLYIEDRFKLPALESTSDEIMTAFRSQVIDSESKDKLRQMLFLSDLVKFAKLMPVEAEHQLALQQAFDFVNATKRDEASEAEVFASIPPTSVQAGAARPISAPEVKPEIYPPQQQSSPAPVKIPTPEAVSVETPIHDEKHQTGARVAAAGSKRKMWIKIVLPAVMAIGIFLAIVFLGGEGSEPDFNEKLREISREMNKSCPLFVDRETRLDSTAVLPGRIFQYHYTLVRTEAREVDKKVFIERMEPAIVQNVRKNPQLAIQRENKVTMEYVYKDRTGKYLFNIRVTPNDY